MASGVHIEALASLKAEADRALARGEPAAARERFRQAVMLAPERVDLWLGLAACERATGDLSAALAAVEKALAAQPRAFPAHLMKGSLLEAAGHPVQASAAYGVAIKLAPADDQMAGPTRKALAHARAAHAAHVEALAQSLRQAAGLEGGLGEAALDRRADRFIDALVGRRRIYQQEPVGLHYPGMPTIEFYERDEFPFLEALEARTVEIREELLSVWADGSPGLTPYVAYPPGVPLDQWAELNNSLSWTAYHLWYYGEPAAENASRCPRTMQAIEVIDMPHVPGRSPAAMFSILKPRTRIPPHTGIANTRLVLHLPLIVPEGCGFRVGGETRAWREGVAWVFDDTIEHEAWNESDRPRAVLITDVWSPRLSAEERELIGRLCAALDRFNGGAPTGDNL